MARRLRVVAAMALRSHAGVLGLGCELMDRRISLVKEFIENNLHEVRNIEDIARHANIAYDTLKKVFRRTEGLPLSRYLTLARVAKMKALLADGKLKCFEICYQVGFEREDTGSKVFKRETGLTMVEFRNTLLR